MSTEDFYSHHMQLDTLGTPGNFSQEHDSSPPAESAQEAKSDHNLHKHDAALHKHEIILVLNCTKLILGLGFLIQIRLCIAFLFPTSFLPCSLFVHAFNQRNS